MKILVVDDAADIRIILRKYLQNLNHQVEVAEDGDIAWDLLQRGHFDIVISDWLMPNRDGVTLCRDIRKETSDTYIYVILLTGLSAKENLIKGLEAGADDFLTKPVNFDELEVRLSSAQRIIDFENVLKQKNEELDKAHQDLQSTHEVILTDLKNAATVQRELLPQFLDTPRIESAWFYHPAVMIGGDSFDCFFVAEDVLAFYCVDVSGHGISSALVSISLHSMMSGLIDNKDIVFNRKRLPEMLVEKTYALNKSFLENHDHDYYFTMVLGLVDMTEKKIHMVQAGHPEPIFYSHKNNACEILRWSGFPVGLLEEAEYESQTQSYSVGDKLMLYSDGLNEMTSSSGEMLDVEMLRQRFNDIQEKPLKDMMMAVEDNWFEKEELSVCPDDLSVLAFHFLEESAGA